MRAMRAFGTGLGVALAGIVALGCGDDDGAGPGPSVDAGGPPPVVLCGPSDDVASDTAVFDRLTTSRWEAGGCDPTGRPSFGCWRLELRGDGTFSWTFPPDQGGMVRTGGWNFRAADEASGLLCLGEGATLGFRYNTASTTGMPVLELGTQSYLPIAPVAPGGDRAALPSVTSQGLFALLSEHAWRKTNDFDVEMQPDLLTLGAGGFFDASYRAGACTHAGRWGLVDGHLLSWSDPNTCDTRSGPMSAQQARLTTGDERPAIDGDLLRFLSGATYVDANAPATDPRFGFVSYSGDERLEIDASYSGVLQNGVQTQIRFVFRNEGKSDQWMGRLRIRFQPLTEYGYPEGMPTTLVDDDFAQATVAPGNALEHIVSITPPVAGRHLLDVDVTSSTLRHSFPNGRAYRVTVTP